MPSSYRQILRSSSILGAASLANIVLGVARQKVLALLLGPAGVGMLGLFQSLVTSASTVAGMGVGNAGTRQIAEAAGSGDEQRLAVARRALLWMTIFLSLAGALLVWLFRGPLSGAVLGDRGRSGDFAMLAASVALTVGAASQFALLVGMQRIGDVARLTVVSALVSTIVGVVAVARYGERALLFFVLSAPLAAVLVGFRYTLRLPRGPAPPFRLSPLVGQWKAMLALGVAATLGGLATTWSQLVVRMVLKGDLGPVALGEFQAVSNITVTYVGLILQAMSTDYYPRITKAAADKPTVNRLVNEQAEITLLLGGPVLLLVTGAAPLAITILYSSAFAGAADLLRLQVFGDILRLMSWPLGYLILALGAGRTFVVTESLTALILVGGTMLFVPSMGLEGAGVAMVLSCLAYLPVLYVIARRYTGFRWAGRVLRLEAMLIVMNAVVYALAWVSNVAALAVAILFVVGFAVTAANQFRADLPERVLSRLEPLYRLQSRMGSRFFR